MGSGGRRGNTVAAMFHDPTYLAFAPLLGWFLHAILRLGPLEGWLERWFERLAAQREFVARQAFPGDPERGGLAALVMIVVLVGFAAWALRAMGYILGQHDGRLVADVLIWLSLFSVRKRAFAGLDVMRSLAAGQTAQGREQLRGIGGELPDDADQEAVAGRTVWRLGESIVDAGVLPLIYGALFGTPAGAAALAIAVLARRLRRTAPDDPFGKVPRQVDALLQAPAAAAGGGLVRLLSAAVGGQPDKAGWAWANSTALAPPARVARTVVGGLNLGPAAGGATEGKAVVVEDIQRSVLLLWGTTFAATAAATLLQFVSGLI